jgi:hypothetical protein
MQLNSQTFQAIADLLRRIEALNTPSDQYCVADGGETMELSTAVHEQIKESSEFQTYTQLGGSWYCFDDDSWTVESGASAIATIFEGVKG